MEDDVPGQVEEVPQSSRRGAYRHASTEGFVPSTGPDVPGKREAVSDVPQIKPVVFRAFDGLGLAGKRWGRGLVPCKILQGSRSADNVGILVESFLLRDNRPLSSGSRRFTTHSNRLHKDGGTVCHRVWKLGQRGDRGLAQPGAGGHGSDPRSAFGGSRTSPTRGRWCPLAPGYRAPRGVG